MFIGASVRHKTRGDGTFIGIDGKYGIVKFEDGKESKFEFPNGFNKSGFIWFLDNSIQEAVDEMSVNNKKAAEEEAKRIAEEKERKRIEAEKEKERKRKEIESRYKEAGNTVWIKFEGAQNPEGYANIHKVPQDGKEWYVLHYSKKPSVKDGDVFFMSEGIEDEKGHRTQVITARGHLCTAASEPSPEAWIELHPWIPDHKWYAVIKDVEILDTQIRNCLPLERVIVSCGSETYLSSYEKNKDYDYLMRCHAQKQHMKLSRDAEAYINDEFDKLVNRFGSIKYYSQL